MFNPWRIRPGTRGEVTTAWPRAASVGARTIPRMTASQTVKTSKIAAAASAPRAIVSGSPIPSRRRGTELSRRSLPKSMREASEKRTSASVASASARTVELLLETSIPSRTWGPTRSPIATNRIAGVIGDPESRLETAASAIRARATIVSAQSTQIPPRVRSIAGPSHAGRARAMGLPCPRLWCRHHRAPGTRSLVATTLLSGDCSQRLESLDGPAGSESRGGSDVRRQRADPTDESLRRGRGRRDHDAALLQADRQRRQRVDLLPDVGGTRQGRDADHLRRQLPVPPAEKPGGHLHYGRARQWQALLLRLRSRLPAQHPRDAGAAADGQRHLPHPPVPPYSPSRHRPRTAPRRWSTG